MKIVYKLYIMFLPLCVISYSSSAQNDSSSKKSFVKLNVNYLSNAVYFGRKDADPVPYLRTSLNYNDKSGFFLGGGMSVLISKNESARIDLFNIDGGYNFSLGTFDAGIYGSKFFYHNASYAVSSELKGLIGIYAGHNLGPVNVTAGGYALFSTNTDYSASLALSHPFESGDKNKLTITPTLQLNAGTQYFNEAYYEFRKFPFPTTSNSGSGNFNGSGKGKGKGHSNSSNSSGSTTNTTVKTVTFYDKNRFTILDYELSIPINYEIKHWGVYANPVIAIPTHAASFAIDNALQKENLTTAFFIEIGAYIKL